ncbi:hypothetical protein DNK10_11195 [Pseudomonas daroniae]|nr:hypothetical protein DNK10_11195 [Pseudomonas daroniae]
MKRILITGLALSLFSAPLAVVAATRNWMTEPELYCSPVPRPRNGKCIVLKAHRPAHKFRRRFHARRH